MPVVCIVSLRVIQTRRTVLSVTVIAMLVECAQDK